jgi:hypothetical protein
VGFGGVAEVLVTLGYGLFCRVGGVSNSVDFTSKSSHRRVNVRNRIIRSRVFGAVIFAATINGGQVMRVLGRSLAHIAMITAMIGLSAPAAMAGTGKDFPDTKCTCQDCAPNGGDLTGQCDSVCKDKTVFAKGSEPLDYCKKNDTAGSKDKEKAKK